jgi:hypothetical protein
MPITITEMERRAVGRHLSGDEPLCPRLLNTFLKKYEVALTSSSDAVFELKMDLDDRELAIRLYLDGTLTKIQLEDALGKFTY